MRPLLLLLALCAGTACASSGAPRAAVPATSATAAAAVAAGTEALVRSEAPVDRRAAEIPALFAAPAGARELLAPSFLVKVPAAQVEAIFGEVRQRLGACTAIARTEGDGLSARYQLRFEGGYAVPLALSVEPSAPHRVVGLWLGNPVREHTHLQAVVDELRQLPGTVSFLVADLEGGTVAPRVALEAEQQLAVGSAFKLYVLAELARAVQAGERRWDEVVQLAPEAISLPSGLLQDWPPGAAVTLQTLATLMIARSDNTATDQLVQLLGREQVEAMLEATGHAAPARNRPFLTTREAFLLKGRAGDAFLAGDVDGRRAYLAEVVAGLPLEDAPTLLAPTRIGEVEWFASTVDLARVLHWLAVNGDETTRQVLAVNPGIEAARKGRKWAGFKGGSEPGVLNLSFVLEDGQGRLLAVVATWNDPASMVDEARLVGLVERALGLVDTAPATAGR